MESNLGISKTRKKPDSYRKSGFVTSHKADEILQIITENEGKISKVELYNRIKKIDPNVPKYAQFTLFLKSLNSSRNRRVGMLLNDLSDTLVESEGEDKEKLMKQIINSMFSKLFVMGDTVINQEMAELKQQIDEGKPLSDTQKKRIMDWVFRGIDMSTKSRAVDLKGQAGEREQGLIDGLLNAMQYGKADHKTIIDGEIEEIKPGQIHD
jgi:hypothetical protein